MSTMDRASKNNMGIIIMSTIPGIRYYQVFVSMRSTEHWKISNYSRRNWLRIERRENFPVKISPSEQKVHYSKNSRETHILKQINSLVSINDFFGRKILFILPSLISGSSQFSILVGASIRVLKNSTHAKIGENVLLSMINHWQVSTKMDAFQYQQRVSGAEWDMMGNTRESYQKTDCTGNGYPSFTDL